MNIEYPKTIISAIASIVVATFAINAWVIKTSKEAIAADLEQLQAADYKESVSRERADLETQLDLVIMELDELLELEEPTLREEKRIRYLENREMAIENRLMELASQG